jgi:hypothetical protein
MALLGGAVAVLLLGVVITVAASRQPETTNPSGTPEATVANFVRLIEAGKLDEAYALTDIEGLTPERFDEQFDPAFTGDSSRRVTVVRTNVKGNNATVVVAISTFSDSDSLDVSEYTYRQTYRLKRENGQWLITGPSYAGL